MLITSLEIARGLAALWVFFYHMRLGIEPGMVRRLADAGFLGVPLFFVISGYCMMASGRGTIAKGQPAWSFLRRRLRRIFPPFWFSILVILVVPFAVTVVYRFHGGLARWPDPGWYKFSAWDWLSLATLTKGLFYVGPAHKPWAAVCSVYWSLAIEVQFYLVVYLGIVFRRRFGLVLLAATAGCLAFYRFGPFSPGLFPQYWPMFALGLLLFALLDKGFRPSRLFGRWTLALSALAFTAILVGALALVMYSPSESLERQTLFALFCAFLLWISSGIEPAVPKEFPATRAFTGLGKMSYSVYLLHIPLMSLVIPFMHPFLPHSTTLLRLLCMPVTLALVYVFYRYCEKRYATSPRAPRPKPASAPVIPVTPPAEPLSTSAVV